ncbi:MAG: hypothetical protein IPQ09_22445 [Myxococcales bacterium]|nr:hypothetical protein [Myxococcales bacterium]
MSPRFTFAAACVCVLAATLAGCSKPSTDAPQPAPSVSATPAASGGAPSEAGAAAAPAPAKGARSFTGSYTTTAVTAITVPEGAKWKGEDGKEGVGDGKLTLEISGGDAVTGTFEGALGAGFLEGRRDGELVTAALRPKEADDNGFYGTFSAKVTGDQLVGTLAASRANAGLVREGKATLTGKR